jgi:hypothetical protein
MSIVPAAKTKLPPGHYFLRVGDTNLYPDPRPGQYLRRLRLSFECHTRREKQLQRVPACRKLDQNVYLLPSGDPADAKGEALLKALGASLPFQEEADASLVGSWIETDVNEPGPNGYYVLSTFQPFSRQNEDLLPPSPDRESETQFECPDQTQARHSADFTSVFWFGREYTFSRTQAACVNILWQAMRNGTPDLGQAYILEEAGSESSRLADVFKESDAWGIMIVSTRKGFSDWHGNYE